MIRVYTCFPVPGPFGSTNVLGTADGTSIELDGPNDTVQVTFGAPHTSLGKLVIPGTNIAAIQVIDEPKRADEEASEEPAEEYDEEREDQIDAELAIQAQSDDPLATVFLPQVKHGLPDDTKPATPEAKRKAKR